MSKKLCKYQLCRYYSECRKCFFYEASSGRVVLEMRQKQVIYQGEITQKQDKVSLARKLFYWGLFWVSVLVGACEQAEFSQVPLSKPKVEGE